MLISKLLFLLTEFLMFLGDINSYKSKRKCSLMSTERTNVVYLVYKISDVAKLTCGCKVDDHCESERIVVSLFKDNVLLGELSENSKGLVYKYRIKRIRTSDSGLYVCVFRRNHDILNTTIIVNVTDGSQISDHFLPDEFQKIKKDKLYLVRKMRHVPLMKHHGLRASCQFECRFYSPIDNVSLHSFWIKHKEEMNFSTGTLLKSTEKLNIIHNDLCTMDDLYDGIPFTGKCVNTRLTLEQIAVGDQGFFSCFLGANDSTMQSVHLTFSLMVDATETGLRTEMFSAEPSQIEFNSNASVCAGRNFTIYCAVEDTNLKMFLYKVHPLADLSGSILYMNRSVLLKMQFPDAFDKSLLSNENDFFISNKFGVGFINYTIVSFSFNDTGRYACVIEDVYRRSTRWKSMHLSLSECDRFGMFLSITVKYFFCAISIVLTSLLFICLFIIIKCKYRNDHFKKFPIRKIIIIEYESPIYKSMLNAPTNFTAELNHSNYLMPDSDPLLPPIIKIKPIKRTSSRKRGRSYGEQLPSTSTDRTRLESTRLSLQLENDVFESNHSDSSLKIRSELQKSISQFFDSMYEFPHDHQWEFPREKLKITTKKLGEGAFGMVYEGLARDICDRYGVSRVGVKMMKDDFSDSNVFDFVKEIETMKQIGRHRHVIQLLGVCTQNGPLRVIVELAPYGNLRDYLRSKCPKTLKSSEYPSALSRSMLCIYALQIARGMTYLSSRSVVHRDLSARNILVGENYDMKIADFGLTRIVDYYYRKKTDGILPIKWMAPEALLEKKYTTKSDVWSYGILLWEIFSLGDSPYASILPENVVCIIKRGVQNPRPIMANLEIYRLMQQCWHMSSESRPHFYQIVEILKEILQRVDDEPEQNIYHSETLYLEMESEYLEPK